MLIYLAARPAVTFCTTSLSCLVFQGKFQNCLPAFSLLLRKVVDFWDTENDWKHSGVELPRTDVQEFITEILWKPAEFHCISVLRQGINQCFPLLKWKQHNPIFLLNSELFFQLPCLVESILRERLSVVCCRVLLVDHVKQPCVDTSKSQPLMWLFIRKWTDSFG